MVLSGKDHNAENDGVDGQKIQEKDKVKVHGVSRLNLSIRGCWDVESGKCVLSIFLWRRVVKSGLGKGGGKVEKRDEVDLMSRFVFKIRVQGS